MFEQTSDESAIHTSFSNIANLYEQVSKLLGEIDKQFKDKNFYPNLNNPNAICRWRSDLIENINGWQVGSIVRPYVFAHEEENDEIKKQVVIHISMKSKIPIISFGIFTYNNDITNLRIGIGDHWLMYWPFQTHNNKDFNFNIENEYFINSEPINDKVSNNYKQFAANSFTSIRLFRVNSAESLNRLVISPSIELFTNGVINIENLDSSEYIASSDYFELMRQK
ncbi:hypothetical protein [Methanolobus sp.]|uniref:hypothetical protein n=1 Tax=Methanolobus sp. TaxID=1874737 RepID=UPI0025F39BF9|nr:hypothetical protein [Methanolobus sp.]